ncbi:MAG TPA: DUF1232 domain-containing protein [Candidatus Limnocylindrales bacterium]|nr:DUF1232 domain-containing protein [Candidatus Limnocylindrales bacterium]
MFKNWKLITKKFKSELSVYKCVLRDKRTPFMGKIFLGMAIGYLLLPFDLIPDFIPVLGQLDDLLIVPGLFIIGIKLIPKEIIDECRKKQNRELISVESL